MAEGPSPSVDRDKWERRRAGRRAQPASAATEEVLERPANLNRAFVLWLVIGVVTAVALIGIVILFAAFNLRGGYRGARVLLTVVGAGSFLSPLVILAGMIGSEGVPILALLPLLLSAAIMAAVILMWRPDVSAYFETLRSRLQRR